jgi:hypothetical protein
MTLDERLHQSLAEWHPDPGRQTLNVPDDSGWTVSVAADQHDALATRVWEIALRRAGVNSIDVSAWAAGTVNRVTGLLEPLKLIEIDPTLGVAQLRSEQPSQRNDDRHYYEVLLHADAHALVRRYHARGVIRREQVGFALTHEVLAKLVSDLAASV